MNKKKNMKGGSLAEVGLVAMAAYLLFRNNSETKKNAKYKVKNSNSSNNVTKKNKEMRTIKTQTNNVEKKSELSNSDRESNKSVFKPPTFYQTNIKEIKEEKQKNQTEAINKKVKGLGQKATNKKEVEKNTPLSTLEPKKSNIEPKQNQTEAITKKLKGQKSTNKIEVEKNTPSSNLVIEPKNSNTESSSLFKPQIFSQEKIEEIKESKQKNQEEVTKKKVGQLTNKTIIVPNQNQTEEITKKVKGQKSTNKTEPKKSNTESNSLYKPPTIDQTKIKGIKEDKQKNQTKAINQKTKNKTKKNKN